MSSVPKMTVTPDELRLLSWKLAQKVVDNSASFKPDMIVALWRGGASIGMYVHGYLRYKNIETDHVCIRTSSYSTDMTQSEEIAVHSVKYILKNANKDTNLLIIDDIFDTGRSLQAFISKLHSKLGENTPKNIKTATVYWKPLNNRTEPKIVPDYYVVETQEWVVFPHEIEDLGNIDEIERVMGPSIANFLREIDGSLTKKQE